MILKLLKHVQLQIHNMAKFKFSLVFLFLCILAVSNGQGITDHSATNEEAFKFRVKQLNEFIDLFNNNVDFESRGISLKESQSISRETVISSLLNMSDPRLDQEGGEYSKEYEETAKEFISVVANNNFIISKSSEDIYALATTTGTFKKQAVKFNIILQQELVGKNMLKWVISNVDADFLEFLKDDTINLRFLPPSSDELDFIELRRALNDVDYLDQYAYRDYSYDPLSVFFYFLNNGDLKIETVPEVRYMLFDIPGWTIELSDFNRTSKNSGWLISNLSKRVP